jgi:hypothetical protein
LLSVESSLLALTELCYVQLELSILDAFKGKPQGKYGEWLPVPRNVQAGYIVQLQAPAAGTSADIGGFVQLWLEASRPRR